jgi:RHS repeat-associated protein
MADGTTGSANHLPPYLDMLFASIDSDGFGEADSIVLFSALPPLGWTRYSDLDDTFPRGASTAGGTGGSTSHSHSVTITTGQPVGTSSADGGLVNTATSNHTHSCATNTNTYSNLPPYLEVIYGQRKDPAPSASIGSEEAVSSGGGGGITYQYIYDGDNNMVAETIGLTTTIYIGNIYEKKDQGGTITEKKYYQAGSIRVAVSTKVGAGSWEVNFLLSDHLGSTSITTNDSGDMVSEMRYSPWGYVRFSEGLSPTDFTYTGQLSKVDHFGLMYYKARWYDVSLGRFIQTDTIIPESTQGVQSWDRYAYVSNSPIIFSDPSGHSIIVVATLIAAIVIPVVTDYLIQIKVEGNTEYENGLFGDRDAGCVMDDCGGFMGYMQDRGGKIAIVSGAAAALTMGASAVATSAAATVTAAASSLSDLNLWIQVS